MPVDGIRAVEFLRSISFPRLGGSDAEKRAAEMIAEQIRSMGLEPRVEEFEIWSYANPQARVEVIELYRATIEAFGARSERDDPSRRYRSAPQVRGNGRGRVPP